ncbi:porin family protein [Fodinibius sp. SL11]|uniref:porin family protein n=1 Tax=Fodinibius sp. SL11 TaxID=3425690 RepID=UPI003F8825DC
MQIIRTLPILIIFSLFTTLGITNSTKAQSIDWGITGGMNISSHVNKFWYIEDDIELRLRPDIAVGYNVGFIARTKLTRILRLQAEPSLILLGAKYDDTFRLRGTEFQTDSRTELTYVQLPLLLQLTTAPEEQTTYGRKRSRTTFHLSGGLYGAYLLDARFQGTNTGAPIGIAFEGEFSNDVISQYSEYDAGAVFGLGFEYGYYRKLGFETRAQLSAIDSGDNPQQPAFKHRNMAITFSIYVLL